MRNRFSTAHCSFFKAEDGAFSKISAADEATKRQITLTGHEKALILEHFGKNGIFQGSAKNPKGRKIFINHNTGKEVDVGLVFPKPGKNEIRLYMNKSFTGTANDIWYLFKRADEIYVGIMPQNQWSQVSVSDIEDDVYQQAIQAYQAAPANKKTQIVSSFVRSLAVANKALATAKFKCELDPLHTTFQGMSGKPYMEAHHLIPMCRQGEFKFSLDVVENIVCLCPNCHRLVHHANKAIREAALKTLYTKRLSFFTGAPLNLPLKELLKMY